VFFGPRGPKSGSEGKSGKNMMKGSQIWGSAEGVFFIAGKSGSKIGGVFFIARKSEGTFLDKIGEICKIGKMGSDGDFLVSVKKLGWEILGWEKSGMGKCTGGHETLAILNTL